MPELSMAPRASQKAAVENPPPLAVERLTTAECWELLEADSLGRLAVEGLDGMPDLFPVNYTVHEGSLYIRTARGSKLTALTVHPVAAFEIDGEQDGVRWSVVLRGSARRLEIDKEIRESGVHALVSAIPTGTYNFICVTPLSVTGRRFAAEPGPTSDAVARAHPSDRPRQQQPTAIAHFPPQRS